jgi:hypothetical protein
MKKIILSFAFAALSTATLFAQDGKAVRPTQAEIQQKAETASAQFIARYNLDAKQAEQIKSIQFAMLEKALNQVDERGNVDTATVKLIKDSCIESMARFMTTAQRKKLIADYNAGMYN